MPNLGAIRGNAIFGEGAYLKLRFRRPVKTVSFNEDGEIFVVSRGFCVFAILFLPGMKRSTVIIINDRPAQLTALCCGHFCERCLIFLSF